LVGELDDRFQPEAVETKVAQVAFQDILSEPERFAFRDDGDLAEAGIKALAEDIAVNGLATPILVALRKDAQYQLVNGHRRYAALALNINLGVAGFTADMLVPANIITSDASELALVTRAITSNTQQRPLSAEGRQKALLRLAQLGMPAREIARCVGVSEATVSRDIALAKAPCMLDHVREHHISGTQAAGLVKLANDADRMDDLCQAIEDWVVEVEAKIAAEQQRRKDADEDPLSVAETWPQRYLSGDQISAWKTALEKGLPLTSPGFKFRALIKDENGDRRIVIDGLSKRVAELSARNLAKLLVRFTDMAEELRPLVEAAAKAEAEAQSASVLPTGPSKGRELLQQLGLAHLVESSDDNTEGEEPFDIEINLTADNQVEQIDNGADVEQAPADVPAATATPEADNTPPLDPSTVAIVSAS
jgi:ParB-like chromosome segregation protein Spo0J